MRRIALFLIASVLTAMNAAAQTLNVTVGDVTYQFPAAQTGAMTFAGGSTLTIMGREFALSDISSMYTDESTVTDNLVSVVYSGTSATVTVAGNVAQYVTPTVSGAHVTIAQGNTAAVDDDEITYQLSGSSTDGEFALSGSYKCTVSLAGLTLTNPAGAAINITNSKRIQLSAKKNTTNTLTDGTGGSQKACIYSKGQLQLQGNGTLNVVGNTKHAIKSSDYISVKNLTLNVTAAVGDGINCEEYFQMKSGTVSISGVGDDGIQCDLGGTTSTGETTDHDDEDSGNIYLEGGTLNITVTAAATKGVKSEGDVRISGGTITIHSTGNATWDSDDQEVKGSKCISADGNMTVSGGTLVLTSTGSGGKGIKVDGTLTVSDDADLTVSTSGLIAYCSSASNTTIKTATSSNTTKKLSDNLKTSPKGIKADGAMTIKGGTMNVSASYHEAIETKSTLDISGGYIYAYSGDDAINSASTMTISGGYIMANSSGNDGLDSNGNLNISGGNIVAVAAGSPEVGIDAAEQYKLNITGGNIIAIGGLESGYTLSGTAYQAASYSKGTWYGFYDNSGTLITAFKVPSNSSIGATMAVYSSTGTPTLKSGVTTSGTAYWNGFGNSGCSGGTAVTLSTYTGGNSGGPGGGGGNQPGGGGGGPGGGR